MSTSIEFTRASGRTLRLAGIGLIATAAAWNALPVHPPLACPLRSLTGIPCPFCGMTRAVVAAVHGEVLASLRFNPAGILVLALAVFVVITAKLPRTRVPVAFVVGCVGALSIYNVALNPTFT